ncbi:MAG: hypothetical protein NZM43_07445 [Saprospiraceae bacterium]|nr:hypothetical protein [Saprospiraceae bacterium]MDW8484141.1 hypothetical protein [Saprospiraceae bacterium]
MGALFVAIAMDEALRRVPFETPSPFWQPIAAMQWAPSAKTMEIVLGAKPERAQRIQVLLKATYQDNIFAVIYALFMSVLAIQVARFSRQRSYFYLVIPGLVAGLADLVENSITQDVLLSLESQVAEPSGTDYARLHFFAQIKWAAVTIYFAGVMPFLWSRGGMAEHLLGLISGLVVVMWFLTQFSVAWAEPYLATVFMLFGAAVVYCWLPLRVPASPPANS